MLRFSLREAEVIISELRQYIGISLPDGRKILKFLIIPFYDEDYVKFSLIYSQKHWKEEGIIKQYFSKIDDFTVYVQYESVYPNFIREPYLYDFLQKNALI